MLGGFVRGAVAALLLLAAIFVVGLAVFTLRQAMQPVVTPVVFVSPPRPAPTQPADAAPTAITPAALPAAGPLATEAARTRESDLDATLPIPANAVLTLQQPRRAEYQVARTPADLVRFFQETLPDAGWFTSPERSDPTGARPENAGARVLAVCRNDSWSTITVTTDGANARLVIQAQTATGPCA